jgi:hypothetical protein
VATELGIRGGGGLKDNGIVVLVLYRFGVVTWVASEEPRRVTDEDHLSACDVAEFQSFEYLKTIYIARISGSGRVNLTKLSAKKYQTFKFIFSHFLCLFTSERLIKLGIVLFHSALPMPPPPLLLFLLLLLLLLPSPPMNGAD